MKKPFIALLLAGGRGTRLKGLTENLAKPAIPYGGNYRIIDFALSNCRNSGIDTVGLITQYQPHVLQNYVGNGYAWDLFKKDGGVSILPPYQSIIGEQWYKGTAHAIYQNRDYIDYHNPDYVLILSGDHVYKMDYTKMLHQHIQSGADGTVSVIEVPWNEAKRFGIMKIQNDTKQIIEFQEKPKKPTSNLASMGIYIFNWRILKEYLEQEEQKEHSSKDFGKDIIPAMLSGEQKLFAYEFNGYWKDVGTLKSFWEAHMDLLKKETNVFLNNKEWVIYSAEESWPPPFLDEKGSIQQSLISNGCEIYGNVQNSVLFKGVKVGVGTCIKNSVVLPNSKIGENVYLENAIVDSEIIIGNSNLIIGSKSKDEIELIAQNIINQTRLEALR